MRPALLAQPDRSRAFGLSDGAQETPEVVLGHFFGFAQVNSAGFSEGPDSRIGIVRGNGPLCG